MLKDKIKIKIQLKKSRKKKIMSQLELNFQIYNPGYKNKIIS